MISGTYPVEVAAARVHEFFDGIVSTMSEGLIRQEAAAGRGEATR